MLVTGEVSRVGFLLGIERWDFGNGSWSAASEVITVRQPTGSPMPLPKERC